MGNFPDLLPSYFVWSGDHARTLSLHDVGIKVETSIGGILTHRFALANETYDPDPFYGQDTKGFIYAGAYHMDPPFRPRFVFTASTPLYMSQPRHWLCDEYMASRVTCTIRCHRVIPRIKALLLFCQTSMSRPTLTTAPRSSTSSPSPATVP